jgi:hypothetical protein
VLRTVFICTAVSRSNAPALRKHVLLIFAVTCYGESVSGIQSHQCISEAIWVGFKKRGKEDN